MGAESAQSQGGPGEQTDFSETAVVCGNGCVAGLGIRGRRAAPQAFLCPDIPTGQVQEASLEAGSPDGA